MQFVLYLHCTYRQVCNSYLQVEYNAIYICTLSVLNFYRRIELLATRDSAERLPLVLQRRTGGCPAPMQFTLRHVHVHVLTRRTASECGEAAHQYTERSVIGTADSSELHWHSVV